METQIRPLIFSEANTGSKFSDLKAGHVAIRTKEYGALIKWYQQVFNFRLIREWTAGEMQLAFIAPPNDNNFLIEVLGDKNTGELTNPTVQQGYDHLCFNVDDLDKTMDELGKQNIAIVRTMTIPAIGKRVAFIADPFGNKIEFCENIR